MRGTESADPDRRPLQHPEVLRVPAFALFWSATTIRAFGIAIAAVAFQVLIVTIINATPIQIGILSALGVAPYLFLGLIVGALMDRWRRQRTLVITSIGRALVLAVIPVLIVFHALNFWSLTVILLALGVLVLFAASAEQPLLPMIVPRDSLVMANARLGQSGTVAGTVGPALGGLLLGIVGAPVLLLFDAIAIGVSAVIQSRVAVDEVKAQPRTTGSHIGREIADGMRYIYRHRTLTPLAISVHMWFLGNSIVATLFAVFVLRELALSPWAYGVMLTFGGIGGFLGALVAPRIGERIGAGRAILLGRSLVILPWLALAVLPIGASSGVILLIAVGSAVQFLYALAMGIEDANDMGYRQAVAPDHIQGRMNSTIRTFNRVIFFIGALLAGVLVTYLGYHVTIGIASCLFALAAIVIAVSPLRVARHDDPPEPTTQET